jgi:3-hydroxyacyl-CoA dehydrogenase
MERPIRRVAIVGTGLIGASWTALFLAKGLDVAATDVAPGAERRLRAFVDSSWPSLETLGLAAGASRERLRFETDLAAAVDGAELVQENGPERLDLKLELFDRLDRLLPPSAILASSSSGLMPSAIQRGCGLHPQRCLVAHPFNPPHLIPLVELVGGTATAEETMRRAEAFYRGLGKKTIRLRKEVPGHVANRLAAALWREFVHLAGENVASVADLDAAVCWGPGLRWSIMGPALTYHLGGGSGGIDQFFRQFAGPMTEWWAALGDPALTPDVQETIGRGVRDEAAGRSLEALGDQRDEALLALLRLRAVSPETAAVPDSRPAADGQGLARFS